MSAGRVSSWRQRGTALLLSAVCMHTTQCDGGCVFFNTFAWSKESPSAADIAMAFSMALGIMQKRAVN